MRPLIKRKLFAGLISAAGAAVLAMGSLTAGALAAPNPNEAQATNVPYVAWVGEHVRLVICNNEVTEDALKAGVNIHSSQGLYEFYNANFAVEDWSGYQFQPPTPDGDAASQIGQYFDPGPAAFFYTEGKVCIATDYKSLNPGLTRIRLVVKSDSTGEVVFSHQFLVIWLTANKPVLNEAGTSASGTETFQNQLEGSGPSNLSNFLGDKAGDSKFIPSPFSGEETDKGLVQIKVTGSFPVVKEAPLSNILTSSSYTLPEAWKTLAETLSSSSKETEPPGTNPGLWDIHGTPTNNNVSNKSSTSGALFAPFYSDALGGFTSGETATVGPYDPQSADETLISDGEINEYDAPMPAMRIDVSIKGNESGGLGGVGQISGASKAQIYSHNFNGDAEEAGNLYNPYYGAYIPATDRGLPQSSGVTGSSPGGDFPGFLNNHSKPYTFWESVHHANLRGPSTATKCLRIKGGTPEYYETPAEANLTQSFYTDENGEAYVTYTPGNGFYFENIPGLVLTGDGGCDLKSLYGKEIGNSVISAKALYPYEPVDYSAQSSENMLTKTVVSKWEKELFEFPKTGEPNKKIVVAKAQDIDGSPFLHDEVCFFASPNSSLEPFELGVTDKNEVLGKGPNPDLGGATVVTGEGTDRLCMVTNSLGLAAVVVTNSVNGKVDVNATYTDEGLERDLFTSFPENAGGKQEAKEAVEKKAAAEAAAEKAANEAAEKKANEERAKEVTEKKITETQAAEKAAAEKAANEAAEKVANEKRKTEVEAAKVTPVVLAAVTTNTASGSTTSGSTTSGATSLLTPAPALSLGTVSGSGTKSLTGAQKLAKALKACKKLPKSKRAACEAKAEKAYSAKNKKHKK
jgi:hypothetical protein